MRTVTGGPHTVSVKRVLVLAGVLGAAIGALVAWTEAAITRAITRPWGDS